MTSKERRNEQERIRYHANPKKRVASAKEYYKKNREKRKKYGKDWYAANPEYARNRWLESKYGIDSAKYDELFLAQGGACAICAKKQFKKLSVDHCHSTGKVRGLLCPKCNTGLGMFVDNEQFVISAAEYLAGVKSYKDELISLARRIEVLETALKKGNK